jgi:thymidylate synthase
LTSQVVIPTMREYHRVVKHVLDNGTTRTPRGRQTVDAGQVTVVLKDPTQALATGTGRGINPRIAAVEAIQLVGAFHDPAMMVWASPNFAQYAEDDGHFYGAYGVRVGRQVLQATYKLEEDPETRQAVITLWRPGLDNEPGKRDYPCTVALGFSLRQDRLHMHVTMRSNDVWLGLPYDVFQFTQLQLTVARSLAVEPGEYSHTAWSMHLYEDDRVAALGLVMKSARPDRTFATYQPQGFGKTGSPIRTVLDYAKSIGTNHVAGMYRVPTESEAWYVQQLESYHTTNAALRWDPAKLG